MSNNDDDRRNPIQHPKHEIRPEQLRDSHSRAEIIRRKNTPAHGRPPHGGPSHGGSR
jgi:hypothetical protein